MTNSITEHRFTYEQLARMMMREQNIHEGLWMVSVGFAMIGVNAGPEPDKILPSAIVGVQNFGLVSTAEQGPLVFDAAVLNPPEKTRHRTTKKSAASQK